MENQNLEPTPIEEIEYINLFQYIIARLNSKYGEERVRMLTEQNVHFIAGLDVMSAMATEGMRDMDIFKILCDVNLEILKDINFIQYMKGLTSKFDTDKISNYYTYFKGLNSWKVGKDDTEMNYFRKHAELMIGGFYADLFDEIKPAV